MQRIALQKMYSYDKIIVQSVKICSGEAMSLNIIYSQYNDKTIHFNFSRNVNPVPDGGLPHTHDFFEILFFKTAGKCPGDIVYMVDGRNYTIKEDMLVMARPTEIHGLVAKENDYERYELWFDEKRLPFDIYEKIPANLHVVDFSKNKIVKDIFSKMEYYVKQLCDDELKRVLRNLTEEVFFNIMLEAEEQKEVYTKINPLVSKAVEYIDSNLMSLSCIDEICKRLYITKSHLHHLFVKHLNISPKKYIIHKRLSLAKREIYFGKKATEVCVKYGFSDYSAFYRAYKKLFGVSPAETACSNNTLKKMS